MIKLSPIKPACTVDQINPENKSKHVQDKKKLYKYKLQYSN